MAGGRKKNRRGQAQARIGKQNTHRPPHYPFKTAEKASIGGH
jgi:hypothetical protein